jgi:hypothetical protein
VTGGPGALLVSPFNVKWRYSVPTGGVEGSKLHLFSVIMPAKCVSSVSPRFHYRRLAFCFLPLSAILECPYDLAIPLPGIYTKGWKSAQNRDTSTLTVIAELFTIPKLLNQTKCPSTYEQIMKMCHIYTMEYYSVINNKIMLFGKSG